MLTLFQQWKNFDNISWDDFTRYLEAGQIVGEVLRILQEAVRPGISTLELDTLAERTIRHLGKLFFMLLLFLLS